MGSRSWRVALVVLVAAAAFAAAAGAGTYSSLLAPPGTCGAAADQLSLDSAAARTAMLCLTNYARTQPGLSQLKANGVLDTAGTAKLGADLSCGEFSHTPCGNPFPSVFTDYLAGAAGYGIGENIAWGTGSYGTPRSTMDGWLNSTGHRANILTPSFTELGIGYLPDRSFLGYSGATLWSQEFGTRTPSATSAAPSATPSATAPKAQPKKRAVAPRSRAKRHGVTRRRYRRRP